MLNTITLYWAAAAPAEVFWAGFRVTWLFAVGLDEFELFVVQFGDEVARFFQEDARWVVRFVED